MTAADGARAVPPGDAADGGRYRVLVVDDDPMMLMIIEGMLGAEMDVVTCTSGLQATMRLRLQEFEVVCSDYLMPGMDGVAVLRAAAEAQEDASLLLVTGGADLVREVDRKQYYVLQKPFERERLVRLVSQLARISRMKRSVKASASRMTALAERPSSPPPPSTRRPGELPPASASDGGRRAPSWSDPPPRRSELPPRPGDVPTRRSEVPARRSERPPGGAAPRPGRRGPRS